MSLVRSFRFHGRILFLLLIALVMLACSPPQPRPTGVAYEYESAKDMFRRGNLERTLEFSDGPASASPPNEFTERAQVLRVAVLSGRVRAYKELADAYTEGSDTTKNAHFKAAYQRLRHDYLQYGTRLALALGEVAQRMTEGEKIPKELTLDAPYPTSEGPLTLPALDRVREGDWIKPEEQEAVARDAQLKAVEDVLAEMVGGDRAKARAAMEAGPVKLDGTDFALYLARQLLEGASLFDRKHFADSPRLGILANLAGDAVKAAQALLKESPNKDKEKEAKKLQDQIKNTLKNM